MKDAKFMQPLNPTFLTTFSIPEVFASKLEVELLKDEPRPLEKVLLTMEDDPDRQWVVEIEGGRRFKDGWKQFCNDNGLKAGYFLVFTHISSLVFCVCVYDHVTSCERDCFSSLHSEQHLQKSDTDTGSKSGRLELTFRSNTCKRKTHEAQVATTQTPDAVFQYMKCPVTLTSYFINRGIVNLPMYFLKSSGLVRRRCEITLVDGKRRRWPVNLSYKESDGQGYFANGWKAFQSANRFKPDDVISFQVIEAGRTPTFKCYRLKRGRLQLNVKSNTCKRKPQDAEVATTQLQDVESQYLSYRVTLTPSYIKRQTVYLPTIFFESSGLLNKCCEITLVDGEGKHWKMNLRSNKVIRQSYITGGWKDFYAAKNLQLNDVVSFQVIETGERPTLKALVYKA